MKLPGHTFEKPALVYCILPRDETSVVFICGPVLDYDEYETLCPIPKPPIQIHKGGVKIPDLQDETYLQQVSIRSDTRINYIVLKSLEYTTDLEWETVDMGDPKTWGNYIQELKDCYFTTTEVQRIQNACFEANSLSEARVEEARANFFAGLEEEEKARESSGPTPVPGTMLSGEVANDSGLDLLT